MKKLKNGFNGEMAIVVPPFVVERLDEDPIMSMLHVTDIGYYPHAEYHFRERQEPINQYVFIYCVKGSGWFKLRGQRYEVHADQYFILPAGEPHTYASCEDNPWTIYWIHFKGKVASAYAEGAAQPIDLSPNIRSRISLRNNLFEEMFNTLKMGYSNGNLRFVCASLHYYLGTLRFLQQYREAGRSNENETDDPIHAAIHYMTENIGKHISIEEIAGFIGYSVSQFSLLFNKQTGYSPIAYFNLLKIQHACQLLDFTDMKINQICFKIGIDDSYYFSRLFTKIMGVSPLKYRQTKKG